MANSCVLGYFTSSFYWPYENAWSNQNSVFQKCEPVVYYAVYAILGFWNDDYGALTNLHWLVWVHQAWRYVMQLEKVLLLTHYETPMTLIGYCIIANQLWCEHLVYRYYRFGHHTKWKPERLCSSIYSTSALEAIHAVNTYYGVLHLLSWLLYRL